MRAMNLYLLTRAGTEDKKTFSLLARELTGDTRYKEYSRHEAESLRTLIDALLPELASQGGSDSERVAFLDGFFFSYTIAHISKEFDLLKISSDGEYVLNIELKSEEIEESRISRQLSQNRYYLSHISGTIYSFTYVMESNTLYQLNEKGYLRVCGMRDLAEILRRPVFKEYVREDLDRYFRAADYLISPAAVPEKFLQGSYFLTNQQAEFEKRILDRIAEQKEEEKALVITVRGSAGTGKTLLLYDLAMELSKKKRVLILQSGKLQRGHNTINERLMRVLISQADDFRDGEEWDYILIDEAIRVRDSAMDSVLRYIKRKKIPCVMAYDPHFPVDPDDSLSKAEERMEDLSDLTLEFTGNIRINRPVYSFLRNLMNRKEKSPGADYSCIDVLYAPDRKTASSILSYYREKGYQKITLPGGGGTVGRGFSESEIVGLEFDSVVVILDARFYYDEDLRLRARGEKAEEAISLLYEGVSRTRERLCVLVMGEKALFGRILRIREKED